MSYVDAALEYSLAIAPSGEERYAPVQPVHLPRPQYYYTHIQPYDPVPQRKQPRVHASYETQPKPYSSPRVLRLSSPVVCSALPVTCVWQPFGEEAPLLSIAEFAKWRCRYCKAYLNAGFRDEGESFVCNCGNTQAREVHMPHVDIGTYEVVAPSDYGEVVRKKTVCLLDCRDTRQLGSLQCALKAVLDRLDSEVCVLSFSRLVSFYHCGAKLEVLKVAGEAEPWLPAPAHMLFTSAQQAKGVAEALEAEGGELPLSTALRFAGKVLEGQGRLILFSAGRDCLQLPEVLHSTQVDLVLCGKPLPALFSAWTQLCLSTGGRVYSEPSVSFAPYTAALARIRSSEGLQLRTVSGPGRLLEDGTWAVAGMTNSTSLVLDFQLTSK